MANLNKSCTNTDAAIPSVSLLRRKGLSNPIPPLGPRGSRECPEPLAHQRCPRTSLFGNKNTMEHGLHAGLARLGPCLQCLGLDQPGQIRFGILLGISMM